MHNLLEYRRERLPAKLVLTVAVLLSLAATAVSEVTAPADFFGNVMLAVLLVSQFRLWDDLNDIEADRIEHPNRVLCRLASLRPFQVTVAMLLAVNSFAIFVSRAFITGAVFVALNIAFYCWYHKLRTLCRPSVNSFFVLTKYPVFAFVITDGAIISHRMSVSLMMITIFVAACVYEILHNIRTFRKSNHT